MLKPGTAQIQSFIVIGFERYLVHFLLLHVSFFLYMIIRFLEQYYSIFINRFDIIKFVKQRINIQFDR